MSSIRYREPAVFSNPAKELSEKRWNSIAKPLYGLGKFESLISRIAGIQGTPDVDISKRICVMMCADNGITKEGISQSPVSVTKDVAKAMSEGRSCVCLMAESANIHTLPVDVGIASPCDLAEYPELTSTDGYHFKILDRCIKRSTKNFLQEPAMSPDDFYSCINVGVELAEKLAASGYKMICTGEMGIGNTTTAAAVTASLLHLSPFEITGRGSGLDDISFDRKKNVINEAIDKYNLFNSPPEKIGYTVGGLDIAALCGLFLGGSIYRIPVVIDGLITASAALLAFRLFPETLSYMIPSHLGAEKGMSYIYKELGFDPVIHASLKLGEGTGAVSLIPMLDMALKVYKKMSSFKDMGIKEYIKYEKG